LATFNNFLSWGFKLGLHFPQDLKQKLSFRHGRVFHAFSIDNLVIENFKIFIFECIVQVLILNIDFIFAFGSFLLLNRFLIDSYFWFLRFNNFFQIISLTTDARRCFLMSLPPSVGRIHGRSAAKLREHHDGAIVLLTGKFTFLFCIY
jgi:hypothetical protein